MKRSLSLLLCLVLVGSCLSTAALASQEPAIDRDQSLVTDGQEPDNTDPVEDPIDPDHTTSGGSHTMEDELGTPPENPATSGAIEGTDITWAVVDGTLTVSGTGAIPDYGSGTAAPWGDCWAITQKIVIAGGITKIGSYAFSPMPYVTDVTIGQGVTVIGTGAFAYCSSLTRCTLPSTLTEIQDYAFQSTGLTQIDLPSGLKAIGEHVFDFAPLTGVLTLPSSLNTLGGDFIGTFEYNDIEAIAMADREDYTFMGWLDSAGMVWTNEDIVNSLTTGRGTLTAQWVSTAGSDQAPEAVFTDIAADKWYYKGVQYCYRQGLMNGMSDTEFSPNTYGTRAQVVTVLYRLAGSPAVDSLSSKFSDVADTLWYTKAVIWAEAKGITTGYEDGTFRPGRNVTRQEFLTFLYRYLASDSDSSYVQSSAIAAFSDGDKVQDWAKAAENWSVATGLQTGYVEDGLSYLRPNTYVRRSEMATFLYRCQTVSDQEKASTADSMAGQSVEALYAAIGYPDRTEYTASCLVMDGEDGFLYYDGFLVGTIRYPSGRELVLGVY
jgi:uncharacterized repeat protein (TIGR02543 family)